jgi:hypothetical protein
MSSKDMHELPSCRQQVRNGKDRGLHAYGSLQSDVPKKAPAAAYSGNVCQLGPVALASATRLLFDVHRAKRRSHSTTVNASGAKLA